MRKVGQAFAGFWRFLHRPLGVALLTIGIGSWLVPAWINHLQDHRAELNLKSSVIEQIEDSSAQTMRSAVVLVFRRREVAQKSPNSLEDSYLDLKSRWLLDVALIRGRIATYFPRLEQCWDVYADVVTSFISVPQPLSNPSGSLEQLHAYIAPVSPKANTRPRTCHELASLTDFELAHARGLDGEIEPNWGALFQVPSTTKVKTYFHFAGTYQLLGSLLLLYKDGLANELNGAVASGFGGGPWP